MVVFNASDLRFTKLFALDTLLSHCHSPPELSFHCLRSYIQLFLPTFMDRFNARCDLSGTLSAFLTHACDIFSHRFHFDAFSTVHTNRDFKIQRRDGDKNVA